MKKKIKRLKKKSCQLDLVSSSRTLFIIFNSRRDRRIFEFSRTFNTIPINRLHLRDDSRRWYLFGISNEINKIDSLVSYIKSIIIEHKISHTCTIGCSAGGFASILYGGLLGVDQVHAIAPQIVLTRKGRSEIKDDRFPELDKAEAEFLSRGEDCRYLEINHELIESWSPTKFFIYRPSKEKLDHMHIKRIKEASNLLIVPMKEKSHCIASELKKKGKLLTFIDSIVNQVNKQVKP